MTGPGAVSPRNRLAVSGARATTVAMLGSQPRGDVIRNAAFASLLLAAVAIALAGLAALLVQAFAEGSSALGAGLFTNPPSTAFPDQAGFRPAIIGSLELIAGVILVVVPVGIGAAIYLEELADLGFILAAGSLTLALLVLPMVIIAAREAIRAVPGSIREGSLALGATRWQTIRRQVLPAAVPGIATGVILAVSRALGETAPLLLVGATVFITFDPTPFSSDGYSALPVQIFNYAVRPQEEFQALAAAGIIVMLAVLLAMNSFAIWLRNRYEQRW